MRQFSLQSRFAVILFLTGTVLAKEPPPSEFGATTEHVGPAKEANQFTTPDNHRLAPAGKLVDLPYSRPQGIALSPDGKLLAVGGGARLTLIDPATGEILERVQVPAQQEQAADIDPDRILDKKKLGQLSFTGLVFSPDGKRIYMSSVSGNICVFRVDDKGQVAADFTIPLPATKNTLREAEIPAGLAVSADGGKLYAALNLTNKLVEIDTATKKITREWTTGMVPYDVAIVNGKIYVSNWAGRHPDAKSPTANGGRGIQVRIDPATGAAAEGSVSVIDLTSNKVVKEILVGRHASGLAVSPDHKYVAVANAASDTISVIDTKTDELIEKIWPKKTPADLFGAAPNALAFSADGKWLYACNGSQNSVACIEFKPGHSELEGLLPTGWYPGAIAFDKQNKQVCVANVKGYGSGPGNPRGENPAGKPGAKFTSKESMQGSISLIPLPADKAALNAHTATVLRSYRAPLLEQAFAKPREGVAPRPVPERVGEPSVFKHVLYIIKENRTYDQILGDMPQGQGDPQLCIFGEKVTPNQHKIATDFVLLDNTYCSGILSADGHNWSCSAITTDYLEKSFAGFPRSYPDGGDAKIGSDAMAWSPAGFLWDAALAKQKTVRIYGEFTDTQLKWTEAALKAGRKGKPTWSAIWTDFQKGHGELLMTVTPLIEKTRPYLCAGYPGWVTQVPDQIRAAAFIQELASFEKKGELPNLMILSVPIDHTTGTTPGFPAPNAQVADNDLAVGQIVEAVSKSRFWADTCIFIIEDDPQNGFDHISPYRTTAFVISPYTKRHAVVSTQYNQTSLLRTMELMLGLPPMNELDAIATPMFDCFVDKPDLTPYAAVPSQIPLDKMNPQSAAINDPAQKRFALESEKLDFTKPDACPEDILNRILWNSIRGKEPYPAWAVGTDDD